MLNTLLLFLGYALISSFGLYKMKLSGMQLNGDLILGGICYAIGFLVWLVILKNNPLSTAFPIAASSLIIATQIFGIFLLGESMGIGKVIGTFFIIIGIIMIYHFTN